MVAIICEVQSFTEAKCCTLSVGKIIYVILILIMICKKLQLCSKHDIICVVFGKKKEGLSGLL